MKTLGTTVEGSFIVEMTRDEYYSLVNLDLSITNSGYGINRPPTTLSGKDLSPVFKALEDVADTKRSINQIKEYINFLDSVFGKIK